MAELTRRGFLGGAAVGALPRTAAPARAGASRKPNVLVIYTDEHSWWTLGVYGSRLVGTPNIDRIGREGAVFRNYFVNSAVCTPSRGCFITGRYPHAHGAYRNNIELNRDEVTLAHLFQRAGYETGMAGKWHLDGEPRPGWMKPSRSMGFADCKWMYNRGHWKRVVERPCGWPENRSRARIGKQLVQPSAPDGMPDIDYDVNAPGRYFTDWLTDKAIEFCTKKRDRPFFYYFSIPDPHTPFSVGPPYDAMYDPAEMPAPSTLYQEDLPDWAAAARDQLVKREGCSSWRDPKREQILRRRKAVYCGMVKCIDDNVGRLLRALEAAGKLDDTLIVFSADHGQYMGEHGLYFKNQLYETAHRVPMLMRLPGAIRPGTVIEECVGSVDVQPTILGLLGLEKSGREQGHDASPLLRGERIEWRNEVWIHHSSLERAGVFTPEWEFALVKGHDTILFDRRNDPDQVRNLAEDPRYRSVVEELTERVVAHNREVDSPALRWLARLEASGEA